MKNIKNKPMFYTGLSFQIVQVGGVAIFGLSLLNWTWLTNIIDHVTFLIMAIDMKIWLASLFLVLYNLASFIMMRGSKQ